jgi:hypothetical protein
MIYILPAAMILVSVYLLTIEPYLRKVKAMKQCDCPGDGGPAFPTPTPNSSRGMTLRDWFAGQAMRAMLGSYRVNALGVRGADFPEERDFSFPDREMIFDIDHTTGQSDGLCELTSDSYRVADAMLKARNA